MFMVETGLNFSFPALALSSFDGKLCWPYKTCPSFYSFWNCYCKNEIICSFMFIKNHQYNSLGLKFVGKNFITNSFFPGFLFHIQLVLLKFHFSWHLLIQPKPSNILAMIPLFFLIPAGLMSPVSFQQLLTEPSFSLQSHQRPVNFLSVFIGPILGIMDPFQKKRELIVCQTLHLRLPWTFSSILPRRKPSI